MAKSKNRRKSPNPPKIDRTKHPGKSLGFGQDVGRKETAAMHENHWSPR